MEKQSNISRLMGYAGKHKYFTYALWFLSATSALIALLPFIYIWKIIKEVLIIAHRIRTVAGADKIVVLADGVVAEQGTPGELYKKNGIYARMVDLQSASGKWKIK